MHLNSLQAAFTSPYADFIDDQRYSIVKLTIET